MSGYSDYIVPLIILAVTVAGIIKKTDIFNAFVEGAAEGLKTTSAILPSLICLMTCIEMVHVKDINAVTGYIRGGCTPIGMKKQYKTVYHSTIKDFDKVIVSGGKLGTQIILAPDDLIKVTRADVCDIIKD